MKSWSLFQPKWAANRPFCIEQKFGNQGRKVSPLRQAAKGSKKTTEDRTNTYIQQRGAAPPSDHASV